MSQKKPEGKGKTDLAGAGINTQLSHLGRDSHAFHGFVNPPVVRASTVLFPNVEAMENRAGMRFTYGLMNTPTIEALSQTINALEEAAGTVLVPSGLAAVTLPLLAVARPGLHVLVPDNVYWPTRRFCDETLARLGMHTTYYDPLIGAGIVDLMRPDGGSVLFTEAPGSNTFEMPDLNAFLAAAKAKGAMTMIDNTWATPLFYKPIPEGFDFSIQAGTKYFAGHSDVLIGSISASERAWPMLSGTHLNLGLQAGTEEIFLTLRGIRTMRVRLDQHERAALEMAHWLEGQPFVARVMHPALPSDPGHGLWRTLFKGRASGLFGFELAGDKAQARTLLNTLNLFGLGYSWGGFESLAVLADLGATRTARPWTGGPVIRLQIGLEDVADLKADILAGARVAGFPV
uniref:Cystathionine beta-lyase n=1 Tax=uncultured organism TaxID=155900 RepID=A0A068FQS8_9ZZZZ|nr:cystathionine beta-lyase [uncultured organism]